MSNQKEHTVTAKAGHGIVSKDDLVFTCGTYEITSADHGIAGKDSVRIANGFYKIAAGKDGIHAENPEDDKLVFVYAADGTFEILSKQDGISAGSWLQIEVAIIQSPQEREALPQRTRRCRSLCRQNGKLRRHRKKIRPA